MSDSIPVRVFEKLGYHHNVVVLTQPKGFVKQRNAYLPLMKARYARYPKLINAIALRHHHYNNTTAYLEEQEKQGKTLVIRPPYALEVGSVEHDSNKLLAAYHLGVRSPKNGWRKSCPLSGRRSLQSRKNGRVEKALRSETNGRNGRVF